MLLVIPPFLEQASPILPTPHFLWESSEPPFLEQKAPIFYK